MAQLTLGSLFSGSGGFELAGKNVGITPIWRSEVEPFPIRVTEKRFPDVKHYGDVSSLSGEEIEPVDIITFGSPCFKGNTLVKTEQGLIPIKDITTENTIFVNGKSCKVEWSGQTGVEEVITLFFADGHTVTCTKDHKFKTHNGWIKAKDIFIGVTDIVKDDGATTFVTRVRPQNKKIKVYDITVEGEHCFPLKNGVIAHNCQDLSVAGKRKGMKHELNEDKEQTRSGLFFDALRIIEEMRNKTGKPRYGVWENVCGAFSSAKGEDFRRVLEEFCQIKDPDIEIPKPKKWPKSGEIKGKDFSLAWRTLDSQYWGVPQRRKRIFLICDFDGHNANSIFREES